MGTFMERGDPVGTLQAWCATMEARVNAWSDFQAIDPLLDWLESWLDRDGRYPNPALEARVTVAMASGIMIRRGYGETRAWMDKARAITRSQEDFGLYVQATAISIQFNLISGDLAAAKVGLQALTASVAACGAPPLLAQLTASMGALLAIHDSTDATTTALALTKALSLAEQTGIHTFDYQNQAIVLMAAINQDQAEAAAEHLRGLQDTVVQPPRRFASYHFHLMAAVYYSAFGDPVSAQAHITQAAVHLNTPEPGPPIPNFCLHHGAGHVACDLGDLNAAATCFAQAEVVLLAYGHSPLCNFMLQLAYARLNFLRGDTSAALERLERGLAIGRQHHYLSLLWWWNGPVISELLALALHHGIETAHVQHWIRHRRIAPPRHGSVPSGWPYPMMIRTFGGLSIEIDGQPLTFSGKPQHKPLQLLKALIALGGSEVPSETLADLLWPETEGDLAAKALGMALLRLRRLLGHDDLIVSTGGMLSLSRNRCRVDILDQAALLKRLGLPLNTPTSAEQDLSPELIPLIEAQIRAYRGEFLATDSACPWTIPARDQARRHHRALLPSAPGTMRGRAPGTTSRGCCMKPFKATLCLRRATNS